MVLNTLETETPMKRAKTWLIIFLSVAASAAFAPSSCTCDDSADGNWSGGCPGA